MGSGHRFFYGWYVACVLVGNGSSSPNHRGPFSGWIMKTRCIRYAYGIQTDPSENIILDKFVASAAVSLAYIHLKDRAGFLSRNWIDLQGLRRHHVNPVTNCQVKSLLGRHSRDMSDKVK